MHRLLLEIGGLKFHAYPTALSVAFLVCTLMAEREGRRLDRPVLVPPQGAVWALLGALFGGKVYWILQYDDPANLWRAFLFFFWGGGLVFYGGLIGGIVGAVVYLRVTHRFDWRIADVAVPHLALGEAITRVGCFLNGCCWGKVCDLPWGLRFPRHSHAFLDHVSDGILARSAEASLPVHPTQLYMTFGLVAAFFVMRYTLRRNPFTFAVTLQYLFLYGVVRFTVEHFRGDSAESVFGMTVSQTISLALIAASLIAYALLWNHRRTPSSEAEEDPEEG